MLSKCYQLLLAVSDTLFPILHMGKLRLREIKVSLIKGFFVFFF